MCTVVNNKMSSSSNLLKSGSPRRESRSPFEMVGVVKKEMGGGASRHHSQIVGGGQKYSFMTAISELEQFKTVNE